MDMMMKILIKLRVTHDLDYKFDLQTNWRTISSFDCGETTRNELNIIYFVGYHCSHKVYTSMYIYISSKITSHGTTWVFVNQTIFFYNFHQSGWSSLRICCFKNVQFEDCFRLNAWEGQTEDKSKEHYNVKSQPARHSFYFLKAAQRIKVAWLGWLNEKWCTNYNWPLSHHSEKENIMFFKCSYNCTKYKYFLHMFFMLIGSD